MPDTTQYRIQSQPFYQPTANEVALYEAAYQARLPVMVKGPQAVVNRVLWSTWHGNSTNR